MAQLKKSDLIKILVEEFGYDKEDLKFDAEGKPYTNGKLQAIIKAEQEDAKALEVAEQTKATRVVATKSAIKDTEQIVVMNGLTGALIYHSDRSNKVWEFTTFGQQETIDFAELKTIRNRYPRYFKEGWLIVLDEQVQKEFGLTEMYKNIITPENEDDIFEMGVEELDKFIDALPDGMKTSFINKAQQKYADGTIDSHKVIKFIEEKFNFFFEDNSSRDDLVLSSDTVSLGSQKMIVVDKR